MGLRASHLQARRRLGDVQRAQLLSHLAQLSQIEVRIFAPNDPEAIAYAQQFVAVFREAGWPATGVYRHAEEVAGLYLVKVPGPPGFPQASHLSGALARVGINVVESMSYEQRPRAAFRLLIGRRQP